MNSQYQAQAGRIPGTLINLGGVEFVMPPMNLDQVQQFEDLMPTLGQKPSFMENAEEALPIILAALNRNYPDLTLDDLRPLIDLGNFRTACDALAKSSGYVSASGGARPASP